MSDYQKLEPLVLTIAETCRVESKGRSAIYEGIALPSSVLHWSPDRRALRLYWFQASAWTWLDAA
jgi:hypothetical protein